MLKAKEMLHYCIVVIITVTFCLCEVSESTSSEPSQVKGDCACGGFASSTPEAGATPLLSQAPGLVVTCDEAGEGTCKQLCLALATATRAKGPEILCTRLVNSNELKLSAFYKVCEKPWVYANMTAEVPLCCVERQAVSCSAPQTATNATSAQA